MTRFTNVSQIANCSPYIRAQLEKHRDAFGPSEFKGVDIDGIHDRPQKRLNRPEQDAGKMLMEWIDQVTLKNGLKPGEFFAHIPNGGARGAIEAGILKGQGVRPGWPDYSLALPLGRFHGLYLELKGPDGNKPDADQLKILARLESVGFKVCIAWGFDDAKQQIEAYLHLAR